jgi:8-oxo-dGTP pyrophosphatase MutT (NUDIX family)
MDDQPGRWRTFGERPIYDSPWVWLGQVDVEPPEGERYPHHVVRLRPAAMLALVDDQDRVLLAWRHRFVPDKWGFEIPGGLVDDGEQPIDAARRELEEEAGYQAGRVEHLVTFQPMPGTVDSEHAVFVGREPRQVRTTVDVNEVTRLEWVPLVSVPGLIAAGAVSNAATLIALFGLISDGRVVSDGRVASDGGLVPDGGVVSDAGRAAV